MRLLIVEDDEDIRELLRASFETECFVVDTASDGDRGSYLARTNQYSAIILDNILPGKNGSRICQELRMLGKTTPILILSVQDEIPQKVHLLHSGADDYVTKPFSFQELLARVRALLRRPAAIEESIFTIEDLVIDCNRQKVMRGAKSIYLTRKEFMLLEYLMKNKSNVLSRGMIMEQVWGADSDPFSNTIEAHILNLRKKINTGKKRKLITTIPGRGYKI
ncbi:MAG TPA: response regulator transcription factor [Candidatus Paceibacterota bacterium]|nr:response regulator transcription factor [Candidatus Paceibacterota bacterium]